MNFIGNTLAAVIAVTMLSATPAAAYVYALYGPVAFAARTSPIAFTDFESDAVGYTSNPLVSGGIRFTQLPGGHPNTIPYIAPPGGAGTVPEAQSQVLEANGDENFRFELASGDSFGAIGFTLYTNAYERPLLNLYTPGGSLIESVTVRLAPNRRAYFGVVSLRTIGWAELIVDRGWVQNVAIDNVSVSSRVLGIPEPANWAMLIAGFGLTGAAMRRRRAIAA
jgi:hypothetical protein